MTDFALARLNMVESQIRTNKVTSVPLIETFKDIPRERFAPANGQSFAYVDEDLPIGNGRYLLEPMVLARLLQAADLRASDNALEIGCATGYGAAILSRQVAAVVGIDIDADLVATGNQLLADLGIDNAALIAGDMEAGYVRQSPFDVIVINGAVEQVSEDLLAQIGPQGRLVTVVRKVGQPFGVATLFERTPNGVDQRVLFDASVPLLPGFRDRPGFVF